MQQYINQLDQLTHQLFSRYRSDFNRSWQISTDFDGKIGVLVSGGIDSSIIAVYCEALPELTLGASTQTGFQSAEP